MSRYPYIKKIRHNKEGKIAYRILVGLIIYSAIYYYFLKPLTIGSSRNYYIFIVWLPLAAGLVTIILLRYNFLLRFFKTCNSWTERILSAIFLLIMGLMFSYLSFNITAQAIWNLISEKASKKHALQTFTLPVEKIYSGTRKSPCTIGFRFKGHYESFKISYSYYRDIKNCNPADYALQINCREGFWGKYYVEDWEMCHRKDNQ